MEPNFSSPWTDTNGTTNDTLSNHSLEFTNYDKSLRLGFYSVTDDYALGAAYLTIAFLGVVLNPLAIFVICKGKNTSSKIKLQLINLAVADFLTALLDPALELTWILNLEFPPNLFLCKLIEAFAKWVFYASILWTAVLSIERFMVVYFPFKARFYTQKHRKIVAVTVWIIAILPQIEILYQRRLYYMKDFGYYICELNREPYNSQTVSRALTFTKYTAPLLITITMYSLIGIKIARRKVIGEGAGTSLGAKEHKNRKTKQVLRMLFTDAVVSTATWAPLSIYMYYYGVKEIYQDSQDYFIVQNVSAAMHTSNCFTTPLIYYAVNHSFREDANTLFRRVCCRVKYTMWKISKSVDFASSGYSFTSGTKLTSISTSTVGEFDKEERMTGGGNGCKIGSHHSSINDVYFESKI